MWTDPTGLKREGEMIDQAEAVHAQAGKGIATLYLMPTYKATGTAEQYHLELYVGGKTIDRIVPGREAGLAAMAKFRSN